jgi:hypothetical protein
MAADSRRLSILSAQEVEDLYGLPRFTEDDRRLYFDLGPAERELVDGVFTFSVAVHLILQLGYFKAKRQFFVCSIPSRRMGPTSFNAISRRGTRWKSRLPPGRPV